MKNHNNDSYFEAESYAPPLFFDNLPELMRPKLAASVLGVSVKTIYDWRYRQELKNIPPQVFLKINRLLYLKRDELRKWITSQ